MDELRNENYDDNWKKDLREKLIVGIIETAPKKAIIASEVGYYYECCAPASIFKYYPDNLNRLEAIKANKIWYSAPIAFNDVFDSDIAIDEKGIFNSALSMCPDKRGVRAGSPKWKELQSIIHQEVKTFHSTWETLRTQTGIACLSESERSLLMWAHYANNHHGICVEYNLLQINKELLFTAVPVIYSDNRVCLRSINVNSVETDSLRIFTESITSKSTEWHYEKEWRIIRDNKSCGDKWDDIKQGALLDMVPPISITLGCQSEGLFEKEVMMYCQKNKINLYKMEKNESSYQLNRKPIKLFND